MPRLTKAEENAVEEFGFEFGEPPVAEGNRRSKHDERFAQAKSLCEKNPGKWLRVYTANNSAQPYKYAKDINNAEHRSFLDNKNPQTFSAKSAKNDDETFSVWLKFNG